MERLVSGHAPLVLGVVCTLIYLVSTIVAFFASYNQGSGREKLTLILLGLLLPLAMAAVVRWRLETMLGILGVVVALLCPLVGLAALLLPGIDQGAAVGNLAVLVPLAGCGAVWALSRNNRPMLLVIAGSLLVATACIVVSNERSAILGISVGVAVSAGVVWRYRLAEPSPWLRVIDFASLTLITLGLAVYLGLILAPDQMSRLGVLLPSYYAQRFALWRDTPAVIQDYLYTGSGLAASPMVMSSYLFLVHVPYVYHVHNLFLQVGIEQGMIGMIGLAGMFVAAFWSMTITLRRAHAYLALCAASVLAALFTLFVSGLFESDVYAGNWIVCMFLPFGFAWLIAQHDTSVRARQRGESNRLRVRDVVVGMLPVVAVLAVIAWPGADAQWLANRAALEQTRIELARFRFPLNKIQDEVRRNPEINLDAAIQLYEAALVRNPNNVTALRRLGQINLSRGDYAAAEQKLQTAYQLAPQQRAVRQMLGEAYAVRGDLDLATELWRTVDNSADQLPARLWWYAYIEEIDEAKHIYKVLGRLGISVN